MNTRQTMDAPARAPGAQRVVRPGRRVGRMLLGSTKPLASLRLTVVLLALAMVLVFAGTLATTRLNIFTVQQQYFYSLWAWIETGSLRIPFPGGYTLGGLLLANLVAAHLWRFGLRWRRVGILLTHAGLAILLTGGLATSLGSVEMQMVLRPAQPKNFAQDMQHPELVVLESLSAQSNRGVAFPQAMLCPGRILRHAQLPFDIKVDTYMPNSSTMPAASFPDPAANPADRGLGVNERAVPEPPETEITRIDAPSAYVTLSAGGVALGRWLVSLNFGSELQDVQVAGRSFQIALQPRRYYQPYSVELVKFIHEKYPGTDVDKSVSSQIRLTDPRDGTDFEFTIAMNHPLRYGGQTFYQAGFLPGDAASVLQVVKNPSWRIPYVGCLVVALGLLLHFGQRLISFAGRQRA